MPKPLPPATTHALNPPPSAAFPYAFFADVAHHPFQPLDAALNLRNAWWLMDAAFLSYSAEAAIHEAYETPALHATVKCFMGRLSTQAYVAASEDWIVLAFRGTQVDDFWSSVIDWTVDARFVPVPDRNSHFVHSGFLHAVKEVWGDVRAYVASLQATRLRPLWITGHSLGAALATIAANLACDDQALGLRGVYTYGSPRVGDAAFGRAITAPVLRFRHNSDLVTNVPLGLVFRHIGMLAFIDGAGHFHGAVTGPEELLLEAGSARMSAGEAHTLAGLLRGLHGGAPVPGFLADHAPINYAVRIWNCYEASQAR